MRKPADIRIDENGDTWIRYWVSGHWVEINQDQLERTEAEWRSKTYPITINETNSKKVGPSF